MVNCFHGNAIPSVDFFFPFFICLCVCLSLNQFEVSDFRPFKTYFCHDTGHTLNCVKILKLQILRGESMERTAWMSERGTEREGEKKRTQETSQTSNDRFKHFPVVNAGITCTVIICSGLLLRCLLDSNLNL